jgi:hypothetical protein
MIISASYRTDIPAFYAPWFMARLAAGFCRVRNPYGGPDSTVSLAPSDVDGFVFWTRNLGPLMPHLEAIGRRAPFYVQFTITGYPRPLERAVVAPERASDQLLALRAAFGPRAGIWRYDPIVISSLTPAAWHRETFAGLARRLAGSVDEVVVSFAAIYRKTRRNLDAAARRHGFAWEDPTPEAKTALLAELAAIAASEGMRLTLCTQPDLVGPDIQPARCIDAERLGDIAGRALTRREKGNRPGCLCTESRDIGAYESCPHGCVYCYAVAGAERARRNHRAHDPDGDFLLGANSATAAALSSPP